jgi:hypothetical protein
LLIVSACAPSEKASPTVAPSPRPEVTETLTIPTALETLTPVSTDLSPMPTLSESEAYNLLASQLLNNGDCQLPCFWGVVPGKSSPEDMEMRLMSLGSIADTSLLGPTRGSIYFAYPKNDLLIDVGLSYRSIADETTIQVIMLSTQVRREAENTGLAYGTMEYDEILGAYSVQNILAKYGIPTQVLVRADIIALNYTPSPANDLSPETFEITLLYPDQGVFVRYNMLAERLGDNIRGCPAKAFVDLWLLSPETKTTYQDILSFEDQTWEGNWPYSKSVEEAAQITIEEFSQRFKERTDDCLEAPLNIWPGH